MILHEDTKNLIELEVVSNTKNKALEIIKKAKEAKKNYKDIGYSCKQYAKIQLKGESLKLEKVIINFLI